METFTKLFGGLFVFVYACFDTIVVRASLADCRDRTKWCISFARWWALRWSIRPSSVSAPKCTGTGWKLSRNHHIPMEWAERGVRKENHVLPHQRRMARKNACGVYFIFNSMEQGAAFRLSVPKLATPDPNHRIPAHQQSRFAHYYFYLRDAVLGPMVIRVGSFLPFQPPTICMVPLLSGTRAEPAQNWLSQE
jgi:hypothetical protein